MSRMWSRTHDGTGLPDGVEVLRHEDGLLVVEAKSVPVWSQLRALGFKRGDPVRRKKREALIVKALKLTFSELLKGLIAGTYDDVLQQLLEAEEKHGQNRVGAKRAINVRLSTRG